MNTLKTICNRILHDIRQNHIALSLLAVYLVTTQLVFQTVCPFAILTGLPCPACGLTRGALLVFCGNFPAAAQQNPAIFLWLPFLIYLIIFRYFFGKKPPLVLPLTIFLCLFTFILYGYRFACGSPASVPCPGILRIVFCTIL